MVFFYIRNKSMLQFSAPGFRTVLQRDFNLCFFISLTVLSLYPDVNRSIIGAQRSESFLYLVIPTFNGIYTTLLTLLLHQGLIRKEFIRQYYADNLRSLTAVSFLAGFLSIYITLSAFGTYVISLLIIYLAYLNVKDFARRLSGLLQPDTLATAADLGEFANFFINLLITFAVINLSINSIHHSLTLPEAFNFGNGLSAIVNALYFSIITMTTVGYGDIIPHTAIARIVVALECLTSYLMLGIMIGIITRGITFTKK